MGTMNLKTKKVTTILYMALLILAVMMPLASATSIPPQFDECARSVGHLDVTCEGGDITTDNFGGSCRQIICESTESSMTVLACDKPGYPIAQYYEVYRQNVVGSEVTEVCVGDACVGDRGFAMGDNFPICGETPEAYCGDGVINQETEDCDGTDGVTEGFYCSNNCALVEIPTNEVCEIDHRTQTQGGWGTGASGDNPGTYRDANFDGAFPDGVRIGLESEFSALFETSLAAENFLPQGGPSDAFDQNYVNPESTNAGVLGGQALSLALSLGFDAFDPDFSGSDTSLKDLIVVDEGSACYGMSVQQVMDEANLVLGGLGTFTPTQISDCLALINENFVDGTTDNKNLDCAPREEPFCGDGMLNQESEECDGNSGVPAGYTCNEYCELERTNDLSCEDAIKYGLLYGSLDGNEAVVTNDAWLSFDVSLVSYKMPSGLTSDQVLYDVDSKVVQPYSSDEFAVDVPECAYQIDLICGRVLETNPEYGHRIMASEFGNKGNYCEKESDGTADLKIAPWFPKDNHYIFVCDTDFEATSYKWYFGDGKQLLNIANGNVWHTFQNPGLYSVTCEATDGQQTASDSMLVNVAPWNGVLV